MAVIENQWIYRCFDQYSVYCLFLLLQQWLQSFLFSWYQSFNKSEWIECLMSASHVHLLSRMEKSLYFSLIWVKVMFLTMPFERIHMIECLYTCIYHIMVFVFRHDRIWSIWNLFGSTLLHISRSISRV